MGYSLVDELNTLGTIERYVRSPAPNYQSKINIAELLTPSPASIHLSAFIIPLNSAINVQQIPYAKRRSLPPSTQYPSSLSVLRFCAALEKHWRGRSRTNLIQAWTAYAINTGHSILWSHVEAWGMFCVTGYPEQVRVWGI